MKPIHPIQLTAYLERVGAVVLNFRTAMIKKDYGHYYQEKAIIRIKNDGTVTCTDELYGPTEEEAASIKVAMAGFPFPKSILTTEASLALLRPKVPADSDLYVFYKRGGDARTGDIIMVQERRKVKSGTGKAYKPWSFMDYGEWECMEPEGPLPFFQPRGELTKGKKIMIHEGAKSAAAAQRIVANGENHPWLEELSAYEHWGMIGGALVPHRSDYSQLREAAPNEIVYVCDRDYWGEAALQKVSRAWSGALIGIKYGDKFPESFDVADDIPAALFSFTGRYIGPSLKSLMEPATFATEIELIPSPSGKGKPKEVKVLRPEFAQEWMHSIKPRAFVHRNWPDRLYNQEDFDSLVQPFSHSQTTSKLLLSDGASKSVDIKYTPAERAGIYSSSTGRFINTHVSSDIKAEKGDCSLWEDFIKQLVPDAHDRRELLRWCATLICAPANKINYGVLLISEQQGVGKGTLGEKILAPLVGINNVSTPSEQEIVESQYNYWLSHKRLAIVHEIYSGHSSKAYNKLKTIITDRYVSVARKYMATYEIENWIHVFACSNSKRAIRLSDGDRRWLVPRISEAKRPNSFWRSLNEWLVWDNGLGKIKWWLNEFLEREGVIQIGADAPLTSLKKEIIEESYSAGQLLIYNLLAQIEQKMEAGELPQDIYLLDCDLVKLIRNTIYDGKFNDRLEKPMTVRKIAKERGWKINPTKANILALGRERYSSHVITRDQKIAELTPGELIASNRYPFEVLA